MSTSPLVTCESEPIHLLGAIQPIGFLLAVNADWIVVRASDNAGAFIGRHPVEIIGQPVDDCLTASVLHDIRNRLQISGAPGIVEHLYKRRLRPDGPFYGIAIHRAGPELVLEFEPSNGEELAAPDILRGMIGRIERHRSLPAVYREAARQVRALTEFDRVMIYTFDEDGAGEVVGESVRGGMAPYLGLHYPASDIPAQARALYTTNLLRCIVDVDAEPVPVSPAISPEGEQLDLSQSILRSVSPVHIEYLRNMGVRSSLSISIMRDGALWGLIACHHEQPKHVGLGMRSVGELFSKMLSSLLEVRQREQEAAFDLTARDIHHRIATAFASPTASLQDIPDYLFRISDYIACDGVGAYHAGNVSLAGVTPTHDEFLQLVKFLNKTASGRVFATHCLSEIYPPAADFAARAAGILSVAVSRSPRDYLVFFRREEISTVTWAGQPTKAIAAGPNGVRLTPRKSFEAWREIVQNRSARWTSSEVRAAESLRVTLIEVVLRMSDAADAERIGSQHRQELLIAELNHRVRNLLGLVRGLITQSAAVATDIRVFVTGLEDRIGSLARSYDLLTSYNWNPASLHALLRAEVGTFSQSESRVILVGPDVMLQPKAFAAMALVAHELVTNARKYGALRNARGQITVTTSADAIGNVSLAWREAGGPPVMPPTRRGFGTTILEQVIPFEVDGISTPLYQPHGFGLDVVLPPAVAILVQATEVQGAVFDSAGQPADAVGLTQLLDVCLIVEDNLFIAVDVEDALRKLGAGTVHVARSVSEAASVLADHPITFGLLDVNLGSETSLPVAHMMLAARIPFSFGTGYGDTLALDDALASVPVVTKPYQQSALLKALGLLLATV